LWKIVIYDDLFVWWWNGHLIYYCWCLRLVVCYLLNIWLSINPNITYVILCVVTIISDYDNIGYPLSCEHQWSFFLGKLVQNCTKNMHKKNSLLQIFFFFWPWMITSQIRVRRFMHVSTVRPVFSIVLINFPSLFAINANFFFMFSSNATSLKW